MVINQKTGIFVSTLLITLIILRTFLFISPSTNLNIGKYNIHHLFIGAFLLIVVMLFFIEHITNNVIIAIAAFSSALVIDEIVYLIATDGSDESYLTPISLWGAVTLTAIILILAIILYNQQKHKLKE